MKRFLITLVVTLHLVLVDQLVKEYAFVMLRGAPPVSVITNCFNLAYVENRGCAWGLFQGNVLPLALFGFVALAFLIWKRQAIFGDARVAPCLLFAGITGNLVDRIYRGCVVDMFDFFWGSWHFPCFNLADTFICVAAGLVILDALLHPQVRVQKKCDAA